MRKSIIQGIALAAAVVAMTACDENAWNDKLDGFEVEPITNVQTIEYTLTDADYAAIASNSTNVSLAGEDKAAALKAVGTQHCFTDEITAPEFVPAFLNSTSFPYFTLSNGSAVKLTYNVAESLSAELGQLANAPVVTVSKAEYQAIWDSDDDYITAFAPSHKPSKYLPGIIAATEPDLGQSPYVVAVYNYADQDPIFNTPDEGGDTPSEDPAKYLIVTNGKAAQALAETKTYGYLSAVDVTAEDIANPADELVFTFTPAEGGYYIQDCYDRYLYQAGTYNSFNVNAEVQDGSVWTLETQSDGTTMIVNATVNKTIQYDENYNSYGSYATVTHALPNLYVPGATGGDDTTITGTYVIETGGKAAIAAAEDKKYGYLTVIDVDASNLTDIDATAIFTIGESDGLYTIQDCYGRYLYQTGSYNSFNFSAELVDGSLWTIDIQDDGTWKITNDNLDKTIQYDENYNSYGSYLDITHALPVLHKVAAPAKVRYRAPINTVVSQLVYSLYEFDGTKWAENASVALLQPSDYSTMGYNSDYMSAKVAAQNLPIYLKTKYPYAVDGDTQIVAYFSDSNKSVAAAEYTYNGTEWIAANGMTEVTNQFVRTNGNWNYDPSVTLTLPAGKGQPLSTTYFQACVNWVYENIDKPLGATSITSGIGYVTSYGNNEYYSGSSAYQGNVDLRPAKAIEQYPAGYEGMSDEEILELMKWRFAFEVMPGALKALHSDAAPVEGIDVIYTINFGIYTGTNAEETIRYQVTAPGEFTFLDCTWWEGGKPAEK